MSGSSLLGLALDKLSIAKRNEPDTKTVDPPKGCRLAQLPIDILINIFIIAGPGNELHLTCRFFRELFRFEDTGFDENGQWHNLHLVISMIKTHYLKTWNTEIKARNFPLSYVNRFQEQIDEIPTLWSQHGHTASELASSYEYQTLKNNIKVLKEDIEFFEKTEIGLDPDVLYNRFMTPRVAKHCLRLKVLVPHREISSEMMPFCEMYQAEDHKRHRLLYMAYKFKEMYFHLHHFIAQIPSGLLLPFIFSFYPNEVANDDIQLPRELLVITDIFGAIYYEHRDLMPPACYELDREIHVYRWPRYRLLHSVELPEEYLAMSPRFFERCNVLKAISSTQLTGTLHDDLITALFSACCDYEIPRKRYVRGLLPENLQLIEDMATEYEITPPVFQHAADLFFEFEEDNRLHPDPYFIEEDWLDALEMMYFAMEEVDGNFEEVLDRLREGDTRVILLDEYNEMRDREMAPMQELYERITGMAPPPHR